MTRRRDILYGSFRAAFNASLGNGAGTAFQMSAKYNDSETVDVGLYMTDLYNETTLQWSYASRGHDADPNKLPFASLTGSGSADNGTLAFYEHRFDWKPNTILWSNNNTNISAASYSVEKGNKVNIPSTPVPLSFRHWSNGDPINSQGPPHLVDHFAYVSYVRFFFNSSVAQRRTDFATQCAAANTTLQTPCNVDDLTLRGSTAFSTLSLEAVSPLQGKRKTPTYSLIALTASGGLLGLLILHGLLRSSLTSKESKAVRRGAPEAAGNDTGLANAAVDAKFLPRCDSPPDSRLGSPSPSPSPTPEKDIPASLSSSSASAMIKASRHASTYSTSSGHETFNSASYLVNSAPLVSKWDPAVLAQAARAHERGNEDDSDEDEWEEETVDGEDYFLADQATEANFAAVAATENDDALGRPDHAPALLHHHASPASSHLNISTMALPSHHQHRPSLSSPTTAQPLLSGYMTPTRQQQQQQQQQPSREDYLNHYQSFGPGGPGAPAAAAGAGLSAAPSSGLGPGDVSYEGLSTPRSAVALDQSGRTSAMSFSGTRRISQMPALNQLHHALLMEGGKDMEADGDEKDMDDVINLHDSNDSKYDSNGRYTPNEWSADSDFSSRPPSSALLLNSGDGNGSGLHSRMSPAPAYYNAFSADAARRPSMISLYTLAMHQGITSAPQMVSVWTRRDLAEEPGLKLAARVDAKALNGAGGDSKAADDASVVDSPKKKKKNILQKINEKLFVGPDAAKTTASGAARVGYLEGLRGFACFLVSFHHFMLIFWYAATTPGAPTHTAGFEVWFHRIFGALLLNQGLKIGIFFVLPARVMGTRYMLRGRLVDLADATLRRIPRLAFPTFGAVLINYFLIQVQAYAWVPRLASRTYSTWSYFNDYDSVGSFINAWIGLWYTVPPQSPVLLSTYATGILWTVPVITQSSFAVLITVIISREISNAVKRYTFFFLCILLSWYADRLDYYFIAGLVIADMDNKLKYREAAARGVPLMPDAWAKRISGGRISRLRVHGQIFAWILFLGGGMCQYMDSLNLPGGKLNVWEHGILPDFTSAQPRVWVGDTTLEYWDPRFSLFCMVIGMFLLADLCQPFATFFMLRFWGAVGRNAFSLFLLHGTIFWSWGAFLCLQLLKANVPYWATVTIVFITSYAILAVMCELFTRSFDAWGVSVSKALWRYTSGGLGRRD